jgi:hypothetical protein
VFRDREKRVLFLGGIAAAAILVLTFVVFPGLSRLKSGARATAAAEADLAEVRRARPEIDRIQQETRQRSSLVQSSANSKDSPVSQLSAALQEAGVPQSAFSVKSGGAKDGEFFREESFEVRMENLTYLEAVRAIQRLSAPASPTVVRSALMKGRYEDPRYLDVTLRVGFLSPKQ